MGKVAGRGTLTVDYVNFSQIRRLAPAVEVRSGRDLRHSESFRLQSFAGPAVRGMEIFTHTVYHVFNVFIFTFLFNLQHYNIIFFIFIARYTKKEIDIFLFLTQFSILCFYLYVYSMYI